MRNYKPEVQLKKVNNDAFAVVNIGNLTEEAAILAVQLNFDTFRHLPEDMQKNANVRLAVCNSFGLGILQFQNEATDEMWHQAAIQNPTVIRFIKKPQDDTVWAVLMADPDMIIHVKGATPEMQSAAMLLK